MIKLFIDLGERKYDYGVFSVIFGQHMETLPKICIFFSLKKKKKEKKYTKIDRIMTDTNFHGFWCMILLLFQ